MLIHEGGAQTLPFSFNGCNGISGPIVDIVNRTTDAVDLFISGHTHQPYNCVVDGRPVTSSASFGRVLTDIDMKLDRRTDDVSSVLGQQQDRHPGRGAGARPARSGDRTTRTSRRRWRTA